MEWRLIEKIRVGNYFPRSAVIFGINNGWSSLSDKWKSNFLILGEGPTSALFIIYYFINIYYQFTMPVIIKSILKYVIKMKSN